MADPNRSAGFLFQGSEVAVFATVGQGENAKTQLLVPNVTVLSVGAAPVAANGSRQAERQQLTGGNDDPAGGTATAEDAIPTTIVSLAVDQPQAQKIILAQKIGELYFSILPSGQKGNPNVGGTTNGNLFQQ
jgi:pilus assembly protein CpaB